MYAITAIQYPSGRWGFVGNVPRDLAYAQGDPAILDAIAHCGPGIARKIAERRGVAFPTALSWPTKTDALSYARMIGYDVKLAS